MISRMIYVQVTYRIRNNRIAEAEREISGFVDAIQKGQPRFQTYHLLRHANDPSSLVHFMSFKDQEAQLEHVQSPHVKRFVENMLALCEVGPIYTDLNPVAAMVAPGSR
jgi:quinol monooxygenase YgiN